MALDPVPNRGPLVQAGMNYFSGQETVARRKKKALSQVGTNKAKLTNPSLSPVPQFRQVPGHLSKLYALGQGRM